MGQHIHVEQDEAGSELKSLAWIRMQEIFHASFGDTVDDANHERLRLHL